ncbi:glycosyltransferase family 1 protein [Nocardioides sp. LHG3406-4]|uniref:glycosyltransferase family 1 protein n=1 Tax=Nocardioides sp. LHG3406-4 TaxID=2804575 RepID=UPI003CF99CB6
MRLDPAGHAASALATIRKVRRRGARSVAATMGQRVHDRYRSDDLAVHLLEGDLADPGQLRLTPGVVLPEGAAATVGWVCTPAGPASGGHTTLFRMVRGVRERGHRCVVFLYDVYGGDFDRNVARMRAGWPGLDVEYRDATGPIDGVDACVASSWESAQILALRGTSAMHRLYFVQDYEPFFFPRGSLHSLAEDTYRFGFVNVALGAAVADMLAIQAGAASVVVPFGCDTEAYRIDNPAQERSGVVFFARRHVPRRGYDIGVRALAEFHRIRPDQEIQVYGDHVSDLGFPVTNHGRLSAVELNALYNRTIGGLALSFTNVTLVGGEMLAAGNIPVANRSPYAHGGLDNDHVVWADPTPRALGQALAEVVAHPDLQARAATASRSVTGSWSDTQDRLVELLDGVLYGPADGTAGAAPA